MSHHPKIADLNRLLDALIEAEIRFILVGGAAAIAHGTPTNTRDIDIVHSRDVGNIERLIALLAELDAYFRTDLSGRRIAPGPTHLQGRGQILLTTRFGPLDLLCQLHDGRGYDELLPHSVELEDDAGKMRVLDIPTLIEVKSAAGRAKDTPVVLELLALLDRQTRG